MNAIPIVILFIVVAVYFYYKARKKTIKPIPESWRSLLNEEVKFYELLDSNEKLQFEARIMDFLGSTFIEGIKTKVEDLDKILIASSAIIPVFRFKNWDYKNLNTVLLYPDHFNYDLEFSADAENKRIAGLVGTGKFNRKMLLSKKALRHGFNNKTDKKNTAIHEFIHLIDKMDGSIDGVPQVLINNAYTIPWLQLIRSEMIEIHENNSDIRAYGGTSEIEFFAVSAEYFFERPKLFRRKHPELYEHLSKFFNQEID